MATKSFLSTLLIVCIIILPSFEGAAYIPTAEQILHPLLKQYRTLKTLDAELETTIYDEGLDGEGLVIPERIYMKRDCCFRSDRMLPAGTDTLIQHERIIAVTSNKTCRDERRIDTVLPTLLFQSYKNDLIADLGFLGINAGITAMDRVDGTVAFIIGTPPEKLPGSQLWICKERRVPLQFLGIVTSGEKQIRLSVKYKDYRIVNEKLRIPGKIEFYRNDVLWMVSIVKNIAINEQLPEDLFVIPAEAHTLTAIPQFLSIRD